MNSLLLGFLIGAIFLLAIIDIVREKLKPEILVRDITLCIFVLGLILAKLLPIPVQPKQIASIFMIASLTTFFSSILAAFIASKLGTENHEN